MTTNPFEDILSELSEIKADIKKLKAPEAPAILSDACTMEQAIEHLKEKGLPTKRGQFYKLTANGELPCQRIGKRLILSRKELDQWIESRKYRRETSKQKAAKLLAESASKRLERAI